MILTTILFFVIIISVLWMSTFLTLKGSYKYYRSTYDALVSGRYVFDSKFSVGDTYYFRKPDNNNPFTDDEIIFFDRGQGSIKLLSNGRYSSDYIHKSYFIFFDPYTLYWWIKIKRLGNKLTQKPLNTL